MKLLLKVKNGTPPQRKSALRQLTDKARDFGAGPLFNQILQLLMSHTLEDQERHLLVKVRAPPAAPGPGGPPSNLRSLVAHAPAVSASRRCRYRAQSAGGKLRVMAAARSVMPFPAGLCHGMTGPHHSKSYGEQGLSALTASDRKAACVVLHRLS